MPCSSCQSPRARLALTNRLWSSETEVLDYFLSLESVCVTSSQGCRRCTLILEALQKWGPSRGHACPYLEDPEQYIIGIGERVYVSKQRYFPPNLDIVLYEKADWPRNWLFVVKIGVYTDSKASSVNLDLPLAKTVPAVASAETCSVQVKQWLDHCITDHTDTCPETVTDLPTRVIDVGSRQRDPKLHEPTPGDRGCFCALSYCWGRSVPFVTSLSTYEDRKKGFSIELLPQTIKHAVLLVRELGISYLWVDSLCIVQDSVSDWEREAARMCDIYSHAVLTIVAVDSPHCNAGIFFEDPRRHYIKIGTDDESVFARENVHNTVTNTDHFTPIQELKLDALHERGWCLQEVTLAPRKVWFKSGEMSWSCTRSTACECRPELESIDSIEEDDNMYLLHGIAYHENNQASPSQWLTLWDVLLDQYFLRRLSDVRDRLPAIAGLAAVVHKHTNTRYLFGLWESEKFLDQLLWHHSGSSGRTQISDPRRCPPSNYAPSWSWASCCIEQDHQQFHKSAAKSSKIWKLQDIKIVPSTSNPYGPGTGTLQLRSIVVRVRHSGSEPNSFRFYLKVCAESPHQTSKFNQNTPDDPIALTHIDTHWAKDHRTDYTDSPEWYQSRKLSFFFSTVKLKNNEAISFEGLLLEQLDGEVQGLRTYRRLGHMGDKFLVPSRSEEGLPWARDTYHDPERRKSIVVTWEYWQTLGEWATIALV